MANSVAEALKMASATNSKTSILASNFIPMEPEEITAEWLFEVINQYRKLREMSLVKDPDDLLSCEIAEKKSSKGRLSSTYIIDIKFKVRPQFEHLKSILNKNILQILLTQKFAELAPCYRLIIIRKSALWT